MLTIWGRADSSNVQAVMWAVAELELEYERIDAGHRFGEVSAELNPNRTVPVLQDGDGQILWESAAILRYLASQYGGGGAFWPAEAAARADVDRWAEWAKLNVALAFTGPVFWQVVRTPVADRDPVKLARGLSALEDKLAIAEPRLANGGWLAGPVFTLADIVFGHMLYRYYSLDIARADLPNLAAYYERLTERPAYREHVMVSYAALQVD